MSIILAIEPDRRRATQLTAMARAHLRAELLVAPTAAQAVEVLDGRVPDVLLTAPLLPSHEEAAMAEHLRQLGPAATHVQTLTIPLLAGGADRDRPVLSAFRRDRGGRNRNRNRTEPEGCDPAVFAEQITEYLREARERREAPAPPPLRPAPAPAGDNAQGSRLATVKTGKSERLARLLAAAVEETPDDFQEFLLPPAPASPFAPVTDESDTSQFLADIAQAGDVAPDIRLSRSSNSFTSEDIPTYEFDTAVTDERRPLVRHDAPLESTPSAKFVTFTVRDDEASVAGVTPAGNVAASIVAPRTRRRAHRAQPVQDEWGFFDPNQCGFPALIAKLDEIAARESDS
jgi:hypothetical protein